MKRLIPFDDLSRRSGRSPGSSLRSARRFASLRASGLPLFAAACLAACGGRYHADTPTPAAKDEAPRGVEAAALPYKILDARTGHEISEADFWARVGAARAVCVGEEHPNPHHHWAQLQVISHLATRTGPFAVGMEMVQRPFQGVLDDYAAKTIDDDAMTARTGWEDRWGYDFKLYRPLLHVVRDHGGALIALNASKELVKRVSHEGLDKLTPDERAQLPELDLENAAHRAWFDGVMAEMGGTMHGDKDGDGPKEEDKAAADRMYSVQVLWDESMADGAAKWLGTDRAKEIVILAGDGHCHDSAIVGRLKRRGVAESISIRPVIDDGQGDVAEILATPMNDYLFVMSMPK
ncbi:MAG TPA: ChaN family lipoprotein [Kofleriaceae bacterium]|nr:ChaN family lipoprotein [Kofleriaceae bacterium]